MQRRTAGMLGGQPSFWKTWVEHFRAHREGAGKAQRSTGKVQLASLHALVGKMDT